MVGSVGNDFSATEIYNFSWLMLDKQMGGVIDDWENSRSTRCRKLVVGKALKIIDVCNYLFYFPFYSLFF